ncbi:MAG: TetR/AcrR family transcriptional regulator [Anaerolineaceae bacterium]|nr:MAG: TetR/AcrR family transcriptional regulator [Anaerolineaceae bacterium]
MQQRSEETRSHILEAAVKQFSVHGFNKASVDSICEQAGVSKGAFYHHFRTKQDVFLALLDGWLQTFDQAIRASKDRPVPETFQMMTEYFPYIFESASDNLPMFLEFLQQASRDETIWQASIAPYRRYHKHFAALIKKGIAEGSFVDVDPNLAARLIVSAAMGLLLQSLLDPEGAKWDKVARETVQLMMKSLVKE